MVSLLAVWLFLVAESRLARADGGAVRFCERRGDRLITVFTSPSALCAGPVDVSVLVQDAHSGAPLLDAPIVVRAHPVHDPEQETTAPATIASATNKLLRTAQLELNEPGRWHVDVDVTGSGEAPQIGFDVEVADAAPAWLPFTLWIGWPLGVIGLYLVHQLRVERHRPGSPAQAKRPDLRS